MADRLAVEHLLEKLRRAATGRAPRPEDIRGDAVAALPQAVSAVPDGLASATLAGVNPVYGLYSAAIGPAFGGLTASTRMMVVTTTTAAALAAGSALASVPPEKRSEALVVLTVLAGAFMIVAGLVGAGRFIRFVSRSVMLGFLSGVAINILLGQLPDLVGAPASGDTAVTKAIDVLSRPSEWDGPTLAAGIGALGALILLATTRLAVVGALVAVVVPTALVLAAGADSVATVEDAGEIPAGLPSLALPQLSAVSVDLVVGAASVAAIVLIQGAGVAQAVPNRTGPPARTNGDFVAQGVANVAAGLFRGIPVGGSVSATALGVAAGARSRWASICAGLWMVVVLVGLSPIVGRVVTATLAAVLIYAAVSSLKPAEVLLAWRTGTTAKIAMTVTLVATLALPVAAAVGAGIIVSLALQLNRESLDLAVVRLRRDGDEVIEEPVPAQLRSDEVVVLDVYGSLLYAGAQTLRRRLPAPGTAHGVVVVLRLRGRSTLGATFFSVIAAYAQQLEPHHGRLYLSGVAPEIVARFHHALAPDVQHGVRVFAATEVVGDSTMRAVQEGRAWVVEASPDSGEAGGHPST